MGLHVSGELSNWGTNQISLAWTVSSQRPQHQQSTQIQTNCVGRKSMIITLGCFTELVASRCGPADSHTKPGMPFCPTLSLWSLQFPQSSSSSDAAGTDTPTPQFQSTGRADAACPRPTSCRAPGIWDEQNRGRNSTSFPTPRIGYHRDEIPGSTLSHS